MMNTFISNSKDCPNCGSDHKAKPFCIYENGYHCFSCGYSKNSDRSFTIQNRRLTIPELPELEFNPTNFSLTNLKWLAKYYITESMIKKYQIAQCSKGSLVFSSINSENEVTFYQQRFNVEPRIIIGRGQKLPTLFSQDSSTLVVVEDFISAIRLAEHFDSVCLWGTKIRYISLIEYVKTYERIVVWLDNDCKKDVNSGQEAAKEVVKMANSVLYSQHRKYGFGRRFASIHNLATDQDPKAYSDSELRLILGGINDVHAQ